MMLARLFSAKNEFKFKSSRKVKKCSYFQIPCSFSFCAREKKKEKKNNYYKIYSILCGLSSTVGVVYAVFVSQPLPVWSMGEKKFNCIGNSLFTKILNVFKAKFKNTFDNSIKFWEQKVGIQLIILLKNGFSRFFSIISGT